MHVNQIIRGQGTIQDCKIRCSLRGGACVLEKREELGLRRGGRREEVGLKNGLGEGGSGRGKAC